MQTQAARHERACHHVTHGDLGPPNAGNRCDDRHVRDPHRPSCPQAPASTRVTGAELGAGPGAGGERRQSFALQPGEPVASFNVVSSLMPLASGSAPQTYRWALGLGILIPVVAGALGFLAFAFVAAALVVPAVYVVYMYDVNQWEDQPLGVVLGAIGAAAALGVGFTFLWHAGILGDDLAPVDFDGTESAASAGPASWCWCCWCRSSARCSSRSARSCWPGCRRSTT